jgi:hypothetical protein
VTARCLDHGAYQEVKKLAECSRRLRKNSDRSDRRPLGLKPIVDSARFTRR